MARFDTKRFTPFDWGVVGGGALVFIAGLLPWYGFSVKGFSGGSVSGWSAGFTGWASILLCTAVAVYVALRVSGSVDMPELPVGPALLAAGISGLGVLLMVIRLFTLPSGGAFGFNYGPRFGIFLALIGAVAQVACAALLFRGSGEALPARGRVGGARHGADGSAGGVPGAPMSQSPPGPRPAAPGEAPGAPRQDGPSADPAR